MKKGMIKVSALYPNGEGKNFDLDYYMNKHSPMVGELLGDSLKGFAVESGMSGPEPGSAPAYMAMAHMYFDRIEDFQNSFGPNAEKIMSDIPNYTNSPPELVISEVKK